MVHIDRMKWKLLCLALNTQVSFCVWQIEKKMMSEALNASMTHSCHKWELKLRGRWLWKQGDLVRISVQSHNSSVALLQLSDLHFFISKTWVIKNLFHNGFVRATWGTMHHIFTLTTIITLNHVKLIFLYFKKLNICKFIWFNLMLASEMQRWNPGSSLLGPSPCTSIWYCLLFAMRLIFSWIGAANWIMKQL